MGDGVRLTLVSGQLRRVTLSAHDHPPPQRLSALACASLPGLGTANPACGEEPVGASAPVDPLLRVEVGDRVFATHSIPGSLTPVWEYGVIFEKIFLKNAKYANFVLFDHHAPPSAGEEGEDRLLGGKKVKVADLLRPGKRKLKLKGGGEVTYQVELLPAGPPRKAHCKAAATCPLLPVAVGETVEVALADKASKARLVAQVGLSQVPIGAGKTFIAESAGLLVVSVEGGKGEGPEIEVTVSLPGAETPAKDVPQTVARGTFPPLCFERPVQKDPPAQKDPLAIRPPRQKKGQRVRRMSVAPVGAGQSQAMVDQVVESHNSELDACTEGAENPYGDIVLVFSISGDGSMLGVVVEKASPNLQKAGECMRQKALRWRFPPPRSAVTARYPLRFSPS